MGKVPLISGICGTLSLLCSAVTYAATYIAYTEGAPWSPTHTGTAISGMFGRGFSAVPVFGSAVLRAFTIELDNAPIYQFFLGVGLVLFICVMVTYRPGKTG